MTCEAVLPLIELLWKTVPVYATSVSPEGKSWLAAERPRFEATSKSDVPGE